TSVADTLRSRGVPAAVVVDPRRSDCHAPLLATGYLEDIDHPVVGRHRTPTLPFRFASVERWARRAAPRLGEDNHEILSERLHLDDEEIDALADLGVIGTEPLATNPSFSM